MRQLQSKLYHDLLEMIERQEETIKKQSELIIRLVNENLEKENLIDALMAQEEYLV